MSDVYIKIKMDEKEVKLKSSTLNNSNLAMIFRLDLNQGIYISSEEGEIILPSDTGFYHVEDLEKTYFLNGERMSPNSVSSVVPAMQSTSLGIPLSYQRTAKRSNLNRPPGQSAQAILKRPTFTTTKKGQVAWKKSLVVVDVLPSGEIREKFQVHMSLTEETSSVGEVQRLLKQQLGFEVILLDAKHLPVMGGETTNGKLL